MQEERALFHRHIGQTSKHSCAFAVSRAEGVYVYDKEGRRYLDLSAGIGVRALGHGDARVMAAIRAQASQYDHVMVYGEGILSAQVSLAARLAGVLPAGLSRVYFTNSGSEAVEGALKVAKRYTGRARVLACEGGYHGSTHGALSLAGRAWYRRSFAPLVPGVGFIRHGEMTDLPKIDKEVACVVIETVQGEAGVRCASRAYFEALRARCDATGALLVMDEVQVGMGRTGRLWAFEHYGVCPDILLLGKALGGGYPLGAMVGSDAHMEVLCTAPALGHISTFGGHAVSCAAGNAVLKVLLDEKIYEAAEHKADMFALLLRHRGIKEVRRCGLLMALRFESSEVLHAVAREALGLGVLTDGFLFCEDSLRICPPLVMNQKEIEEACTALLAAIGRVLGS